MVKLEVAEAGISQLLVHNQAPKTFYYSKSIFHKPPDDIIGVIFFSDFQKLSPEPQETVYNCFHRLSSALQ